MSAESIKELEENFSFITEGVYRNGFIIDKKILDFSFSRALKEICDLCFSVIKEAINRSEENTDVEIPDDIINKTISFIRRYVLEMKELALLKPLSEEEIFFIKKVNLLFFNWVNLISQRKDDKTEIDIETLKYISSEISKIENILDGNLSLRELITINKILIDRADDLLSLKPSYFKVSEHFLNALDIAVDKITRKNNIDSDSCG